MCGRTEEERQGRAEIRIRPVHSDDADAIHGIRRRPSVVRYTLGLPSTRLGDVRRRIDGYGADDHVFVAEVNGEVVGMAGLHVRGSKQRHVGEVGILVADEHQGRGVGRALMTALLELADAYLGLARVELDVAGENLAAIRLLRVFRLRARGPETERVHGGRPPGRSRRHGPSPGQRAAIGRVSIMHPRTELSAWLPVRTERTLAHDCPVASARSDG